jgi:hypothetical protein
LSFSKGQGGRKVVKRHHIRIWQTTIRTPDGRKVWLASAHFDNGIKLIPRPLFLVHRIAPSLDTEREYVASDLSPWVNRVGSYRMMKQGRGRNGFGDPFRTDGHVLVLEVVHG